MDIGSIGGSTHKSILLLKGEKGTYVEINNRSTFRFKPNFGILKLSSPTNWTTAIYSNKSKQRDAWIKYI